MNTQLITDHAEHCDFYVGNEHYDKSYEEQQRLWVEKFAELIVSDCIDISDNMAQLDIDPCCTRVAVKIGKEISRRFFGVKNEQQTN